MTEKTAEQMKKEAEAREKKRQIAMINLGSEGLQNLALSYIVNEEKDFGEADNSAVHDFKYIPALNQGLMYHNPETGEESNLVVNSLLGSRTKGKNGKAKRYTGSISESRLMESASDIIDGALSKIKVGDVLQLMGSDVKSSYSDMYLSDLEKSGAEGKKLYQTISGKYMEYFVSDGVADAHTARALVTKKGLETILTEADKERQEGR